MEQMGNNEWDLNVTGMTGVVRLSRHEPEVIIVEYKALMGLLLKAIKNLRSQVRSMQCLYSTVSYQVTVSRT